MTKEKIQGLREDSLEISRRSWKGLPYGPSFFVDNAQNISVYVKEAFDTLTGEESKIEVIEPTDRFFYFERSCGSKWCIDVMPYEELVRGTGFSVIPERYYLVGIIPYGNGCGTDDINIFEGQLNRVMSSIGHEIGHLFSEPLRDPPSEEAKAYAFGTAWCDNIHERNIAGLKNAIHGLTSPLKDSKHGAAYEFVMEKIRRGYPAFELFRDISNGRIKVHLI